MSNISASETPAEDPPRPGNPEDPAARLAQQCCHFEFESKLNQSNIPRAANTRKVGAAKRKTEEHNEESKEVNYDDKYRVLSGRSEINQSEEETKEPPDEEGDPNFETSCSDS